ncbi:MAG: hypothetical protein M3082_11495 [Candidatus Dormibacteraeota bacterium]|nr:hypothetical protein [Candidatus Dormibacteraeota bacterium]
MLFNSEQYLFFLPVVVAITWILRPAWRPAFLLLASYYFQNRSVALAARERIPLLDMHADVPDEPPLWSDLLHLSDAGSSQIAPKLAAYCRAVLSGGGVASAPPQTPH